MSPAPDGGIFDRDGLGRFVAERVAPKLDGLMRVDVLGVAASNDRVAIETKVHAPLKGGGSYENRFHFLFVVRDNSIIEVREYLDSERFLAFVNG